MQCDMHKVIEIYEFVLVTFSLSVCLSACQSICLSEKVTRVGVFGLLGVENNILATVCVCVLSLIHI